jgi:hypothetical protein
MQEIGISPAAKYSEIVTSISLNSTWDKNVVAIQSKCSRPYYRVRLGGPTLLGMEQMHHFHPSRSRIRGVEYSEKQIQFLYSSEGARDGTLTEITLQSVQVSGSYDLEIVQLLCDVDMKEIDRQCIPNSTETMMLNSPQQLYLEQHDKQKDKPSPGYWKLLNTTLDAPVVRTRYQVDKNCSSGNCDLSWFYKYDFVGQDYDHLAPIHNRTFCFLGDSHSRRMALAFREIFQQYNLTGTKNKAVHIRITYPNVWSSQFSKLAQKIHGEACTDVVMAIGQWPLSVQKHSNGHYHPNQWIQEISTIVDYLHSNTSTSIILRSIHYVPLGYVRTSCPPRDWRMPYLVDSYNDKLRNLYKSHPAFQQSQNLFIDTNAVLGPVWDTAGDFNHNPDKVGIPEAMYLLREMTLRQKEEQQQPIVGITPSRPTSPSKTSAKYTDDASFFTTTKNGVPYLVSQQFFLAIFVWFIIVLFWALLRRARRLKSQA